MPISLPEKAYRGGHTETILSLKHCNNQLAKLAGKSALGGLPCSGALTTESRRWLATPVCLTMVYASQLVGCRHLLGDAGLLHILQHGMHGYITTLHLVQDSKQAECLHAGEVVDMQ